MARAVGPEEERLSTGGEDDGTRGGGAADRSRVTAPPPYHRRAPGGALRPGCRACVPGRAHSRGRRGAGVGGTERAAPRCADVGDDLGLVAAEGRRIDLGGQVWGHAGTDPEGATGDRRAGAERGVERRVDMGPYALYSDPDASSQPRSAHNWRDRA